MMRSGLFSILSFECPMYDDVFSAGAHRCCWLFDYYPNSVGNGTFWVVVWCLLLCVYVSCVERAVERPSNKLK